MRDDIDEAILELCGLGRLSAVSCMVLYQRCSAGSLEKLRQFADFIDVGLHLCLTEERIECSKRPGAAPLLFRSFGQCLRGTMLRSVGRQELLHEVKTQYDLFVSKTGTRPDYIDGHLHVHQVPAVRETLIEFVQALPQQDRPYIRNTYLATAVLRRQRLPWMKAWSIGIFGAPMARRLREAGLRTNEGFAGIYDFTSAPDFAGYLPRFANCLKHSTGILVVHPGKRDDWRSREFETLRSAPLEVRLNRFEARKEARAGEGTGT